MNAIRIDKKTTISGSSHVQLVLKYMESFGLSHDAMDKMIEDGRVEFGSVFLGKDGMQWAADKTRCAVYTSMDQLMSIGGCFAPAATEE